MEKVNWPKYQWCSLHSHNMGADCPSCERGLLINQTIDACKQAWSDAHPSAAKEWPSRSQIMSVIKSVPVDIENFLKITSEGRYMKVPNLIAYQEKLADAILKEINGAEKGAVKK